MCQRLQAGEQTNGYDGKRNAIISDSASIKSIRLHKLMHKKNPQPSEEGCG